MYFQLSDFYKRDISFVYSEEKNPIDWLDLRTGKSFDIIKPIIYEVDKVDSYINNYDILPTIGVPLVSEKFKDIFHGMIGKEIELYPAIIFDKSNKTNENFFALNILNVTSCMDIEKSIVEKTKYGTTKIKKLFFKPNCLKDLRITRMEEQNSYIIVTEEFKNICEDANLKGFNFIEEGHSIYTDL